MAACDGSEIQSWYSGALLPQVPEDQRLASTGRADHAVDGAMIDKVSEALDYYKKEAKLSTPITRRR